MATGDEERVVSLGASLVASSGERGASLDVSADVVSDSISSEASGSNPQPSNSSYTSMFWRRRRERTNGIFQTTKIGSIPVLKQPASTKASVYTSCRIILNVKISNVSPIKSIRPIVCDK